MAAHWSENPDLFLHVPFARRWECHKPTIQNLYITQGRDVKDVAAVMKTQYHFDANPRQFKHHLKKWGITKIVPKAAKDQAIKAIGKRMREGNSVVGVKYRGEEIDKKRIRRYLRDESRLDRDWKLINVIFGTWSLPYKALRASLMTSAEHPSPFTGDWSTPSEISILSPHYSLGAPSPGQVSSPANAPTPTTIAIRVKAQEDRARLLIQGRTDELLKDMSSSEKSVAATWLYELWFFAFTTSKHWGRGPRHWTPELLQFRSFKDKSTAANTPAAIMGTDQDMEDDHDPPSLCLWSIHCWLPAYERVRSPSPEDHDDTDIGANPRSWPRWTNIPSSKEFMKCFREALQMNSFSSLNVSDIPLATSKIASAVSNSPEQLHVESIGFAIIARNVELLEELLSEDESRALDLTGLFPFHLAANYLDGFEACCGILASLVGILGGRNLIRNLYINGFGHTVLDSLMMTILKSHTSCTPLMVDERFNKMQRFAGEDMDICGRWDADSFCVRDNNARGSPSIPKSWKHAFCHTSAQTVCHAIIAIFGRPYSPDINTPSGLFTKSCSKCNRRLTPGPLHTLVIAGFHVAQYGFEGETLFGVLACLVCLLSMGADPTQSTELSIDELLGRNNDQECRHSRLNPVELAEQVPEFIQTSWTDEVQLGWTTIVAILRLARHERNPARHLTARRRRQELHFDFDRHGGLADYSSSEESDEDDADEGWCPHKTGYHDNFYCGSKKLGTLWAAIQAELLTYRRLQDGEPWLSASFSMRAVLDGANDNDGFTRLALVEMEMLKPWCVCGRFVDARSSSLPTTEEACSFYFSNLEDWERSNFIYVPYMYIGEDSDSEAED
ncbi:hypothetical protein F5Y16DRAFT_154316 [Xylariaceae sp. FL0255]|nr:hypothetical protein F5Y16DRAFT_154316 [Xylariaceae sp. FL0255]